jgi:hypothetical protein
MDFEDRLTKHENELLTMLGDKRIIGVGKNPSSETAPPLLLDRKTIHVRESKAREINAP